jgi:erythronate-4-phosphate dehydrogenase
MALRIVADRNIALVEEAFAPLGEVIALPAHELTRDAVRDADLVLVRSTVKVGPALLDGSRARFVATATIGIDHLDTAWLEARGIRWASAPGSNAASVVQWFAAALLALAARHDRDPGRLRIGVVGVGQVGRRIERLAQALGGPPPLLCDPPRARAEGYDGFVPLDALLRYSELVTLHVPLERGGDPTFHLLDDDRLRLVTPGALIVNASRGEVIDSPALAAALDEKRVAGTALDVWEHEPDPDPALIARATVATPHIAGHSWDGKVEGTRMIYAAACAFLGRAPAWQPSLEPAPPLVLDTHNKSTAQIVLEAVRGHYALADDDELLRNNPKQFRAYRQAYPIRRELAATAIVLTPAHAAADAALAALRA